MACFVFGASVGFLPRILLNKKEEMTHLRTNLKRYIIIGYVIIYFIAFTTKQPDTRFILAIIAVILFFSSLNFFYYKYCKLLGRLKNDISTGSNDQFIEQKDLKISKYHGITFLRIKIKTPVNN